MDPSASLGAAFIQDAHLFEKLLLTTYSAFTNTLTASQIARATSQRLCLLPLGVEGVTRKVRPLCVDVPVIPSPAVDFDYRSPTVVGGAAMQALNACVQANSHMPSFPTKTYPTSDIDIVWWPEIALPANIQTLLREKGTPYSDAEGGVGFTDWSDTSVFLQEGVQYAVVSSSPYIATFVGIFKDKLDRFMRTLFRDEADTIANIIRRHTGITRVLHPFVTTDIRHVAPAGVYSVSVLMTLEKTSTPVKIVDISIHDGASSQMSTRLEPVSVDPIYSNYRTSLMLPYPTMDVPIPNILSLLGQTVFANNRIFETYERTGRQDLRMKVFALHARIQYMYDLLIYTWSRPTWESYTLRTLLKILQPDVGLVKYFNNALFQSGTWVATCHTSLTACGVRNPDIVYTMCSNNRILKKTLCDEAISTQDPFVPQLWGFDPSQWKTVPTPAAAGTGMPQQPPLPPLPPQQSQQPPLPPTPPPLLQTPYMTYGTPSYYAGPPRSKRPKKNTYKSGPRYRRRRMTRRRR